MKILQTLLSRPRDPFPHPVTRLLGMRHETDLVAK
jgi:hypothetical protein